MRLNNTIKSLTFLNNRWDFAGTSELVITSRVIHLVIAARHSGVRPASSLKNHASSNLKSRATANPSCMTIDKRFNFGSVLVRYRTYPL